MGTSARTQACIKAGVDFEITPLMYAGGAAMLAALVILLFVLFRKLRHK